MSPRKFLTLLAGLAPVLLVGAHPVAASAAPKATASAPATHATPTKAAGSLRAAPAVTAQPNTVPLNIVEYPLPLGGSASTPFQIIQGPDGNMWFSESFASYIGKIDPSGTVTEYPLTAGRSSYGLAIGPDGNMWFTEDTFSGAPTNRYTVSKITPSGTLTENVAILPQYAQELVYGPDGNLWVADTAYVSRVTPLGGVTNYAVPVNSGGPSVRSLTVGQDGNIWFADYGQDKFGKININGSGIIEYSPVTAGSGTFRIARGSDGNLWISEYAVDKIGRFSPFTPGSVTEFPLPASHSPLGIGAGPDGTMWFNTWAPGGNTVGTMTTAGAILNETVLPTTDGAPDAMFGGNDDGKMWFVERSSGKIARVLAGGYAPLGYSWGFLPAMQNNAYGGYTTVAFIKNVNPYPIMVNLLYADSGGNSAGLGNNVYRLQPNATWTVRQDNPRALVNTGAGSGTIWSDGQIAAFVNELAPGTDASSYSAISPIFDVAASVFAPVAMKHAYGNQYTTGIGLINLGTSATDINIVYRNAAGITIYTQHLTGIQPGAYQGIFQGAVDPLPDGFAGTAEIDALAASGLVAAVLNELGPNNEFSSFKATAAGSAPLYAPTLFRNAFGGYNTGLGLFNITNQTGNVTITYYDSNGSSIPRTVAIGAYGAIAIYQGSTTGPNPNAPPSDGAYTALITVDNASINLVGVVNELSPDTRVATSYDVPFFGTTPEHAALVENNGPDGVTTGLGVMNTTVSSETLTLTFYDLRTGAQIGSPLTKVVPAYSFWSWYQGATIPNGGLAPGTRATAVVSSTGSFTLIVNEVGPNVFMSYDGGVLLF